jgi:hypothetical protein
MNDNSIRHIERTSDFNPRLAALSKGMKHFQIIFSTSLHTPALGKQEAIGVECRFTAAIRNEALEQSPESHGIQYGVEMSISGRGYFDWNGESMLRICQSVFVFWLSLITSVMSVTPGPDDPIELLIQSTVVNSFTLS